MRGEQFEKEVSEDVPDYTTGWVHGFKKGKQGAPILRKTGTQILHRGGGRSKADIALDAMDRERGDR